MSDFTSIIEAKQLTRVFKMGEHEFKALNDASFKIVKGQFIAIIGPSGSGKSTLLNLLGLVDKPSTGDLLINGTSSSRLNDKELTKLRAKHIGFVFQSFHLIPVMSVLDNVILQLTLSGISKKERKTLAIDALNRVGLGDKLHHYPNELSGGQRQRVAIARTIAKNPTIILADEPTGSLDSKTGEEIMRLLEDIHQSGTTIIMVTHNIDLAARAQNQFVLKDGSITEMKTSDTSQLVGLY